MSSDNGGIIGVVNDPTSTVASGVWQQEEQYEAKVNGTWPQRALFTTNSARFETNTYLNKASTSSTSGNTKTFTISFWIKRGSLATGDNQFPISFYQDSSSRISIAFLTDNTFIAYAAVSGVDKMNFTTNRVFRDASAWYHIVLAVDTTQSTEADRFKMYINGVQETSFSTATYPSQNQDLTINTNIYVGTYDTSNNFLSGYLAEFVYIDGTALDQTSFGVSNSDGVWTPIPYTGTFGTNGFNLQFENAAALGEDSSGNDNDFTVNSLTSVDQSTDYPVVNYATLNPLSNGSKTTLSEGNLVSTGNTATDSGMSTVTLPIAFSGKWYWEMKITGSHVDYPKAGIFKDWETVNQGTMNGASGGAFQLNAYIQKGLSTLVSSDGNISITAPANDNIIMYALDAVNGKFYIGNNGTWYNSGDPTSGATGTGSVLNLTSGNINMIATHEYNGSKSNWNFGSPPYAISSGNTDGNGYGNFEYAVPSGYYSLNTKNLAEFG